MPRPRSGLRVVNERQAGRLFRQGRVVSQEELAQRQAQQGEQIQYVRDRFGRVVGVLDQRTGVSRVATPEDITRANLADPRAAQRQRQIDIEVQRARQQGFTLDPQAAARRVEQQQVQQQQRPNVLVVEPAKTTAQQYQQAVRDQGFFRGTTYFIGEKGQGYFDVLERRYAPRGGSLSSARLLGSQHGVVSTVIGSTPYFVPYVGEGFAVGVGLEVAFDKDLSVVERTVGVASAVIGGKFGYKRISRDFGYPKIETEFISKEVERIDNNIISRSGAITRVKYPLSERTFIVGAQSKTAFEAGEETAKFKSVTAIGLRELKGVELSRVKPKFGKTRFAISGSVGEIVQRPVKVGFTPIEGIRFQKELPGIETRSFSRTFVARKYAEPKMVERFSVGLAAQVNEEKALAQELSFIVNKGRTGLLRPGRAISTGKIYSIADNEIESTGTVISKRSLKTSTIDSNLNNQIKDVVFEIVNQRPVTFPTRLPTEKNVPISKIETYRASERQKQKIDQIQKQEPIDIQTIGNKIVSIERSKEKEIVRNQARNVSNTATVPVQRQPQLQGQFQRQVQGQEQLQKTIQKNIRPFVRLDFLPEYGLGLKKKIFFKREKKRRGFGRLVPSYAVLIKSRGEYTKVATDLPKGIALRLLESKLTSNLARTGRVVEIGTTELEDIAFRPSEKIFRQYRVRGGRKIATDPLEFIQRTEANLQTQTEKQLIKQARYSKRNI